MDKRTINIIYHSADYDGHMSAAIVMYNYLKYHSVNINLIPFNYGEELDIESLKGTTVYMVDVSLPTEEMEHINNIAHLFTWLDHHITAIEANKHLSIEGVRKTDKAACEIVWEYFFKLSIPRFIYLLGRYDVWDKSDPTIRKYAEYLQYALKSVKTNPKENDIFLDVIHTYISKGYSPYLTDFLLLGKKYKKYQESINESAVKRLAFETVFHGYPAIVANSIGGSQLFDSIHDKDKLMILYHQDKNGKYNYSLYSDADNGHDPHCGNLAKEYGGGGHKEAAGFSLPINIFYNRK